MDLLNEFLEVASAFFGRNGVRVATEIGFSLSADDVSDITFRRVAGLRENVPSLTWKELGDKKPFAFVRHPITWLASLHNHRIRKKSKYATDGNWFGSRFPLEKLGDNDWHRFVKNVCGYTGWIQEYFDMHVGPYDSKILIGKMENIEQDLINILQQLDEPFDKVLSKNNWDNKSIKHTFFIGTKHKEFLKFKFPTNSVIIDPFRYIYNIKDSDIIRVGDNINKN